MQLIERMGVTMLYLIDEYMKEYPHKQFPDLLKFADTERNLHEMTSEEANSVTAKWEAVEPSVALSIKRRIAQYLDWLSEKGVEVNLEAKNIKIHTIEKDTVGIYSTRDIQKYFDMLEKAVEKSEAKTGKNIPLNFLKMSRAIGILSFYGLSEEDILELRRDDVTSEGVKGYDLPLTNEDVDRLLEYKNLTTFDNGQDLKGTGYVRMSRSYIVPVKYLNRYLHDLKIDKEYEFLKDVLKTNNLKRFGKFNMAYHEEKVCGDKIVVNAKTPKWFDDIFKVSVNWLTKMKKEYIVYRDRRDLVCPETTQVNRIHQQSKEKIIQKLNTINDKIYDLNQEVEELKAQFNLLD